MLCASVYASVGESTKLNSLILKFICCWTRLPNALLAPPLSRRRTALFSYYDLLPIHIMSISYIRLSLGDFSIIYYRNSPKWWWTVFPASVLVASDCCACQERKQDGNANENECEALKNYCQLSFAFDQCWHGLKAKLPCENSWIEKREKMYLV